MAEEPNNFKELVHYICEKTTESPNKLGATKLNKALWFSDLLSFVNHGTSISNETYIKRQFGPVPKHITSTLDELEDNESIAVRSANFHGFVQKQYLSLSPASNAFMSNEQKNIVDEVLSTICNNHTANSISDLTHNDVWDMAEIGEEIPLYTAFTIAPGDLTDNDFHWANEQIKELSSHADN